MAASEGDAEQPVAAVSSFVVACVRSFMSTPWTCSNNVSMKRLIIDTLLFHVDVIDMLL